ncbi:DUF4917 family protein [Bacillus amyloliquefaciens]|uniref:DUF4917 family protein n=1 Tax=Bacillus amyloliquefaciens TaxID=1390 RepID=UPI000B436929|nr:DUF4917 family protein [Bacillus amyloliquefaciens]ARW39066.1 hypothetical protein S101267_01978 [Bacillus amyloliquefaciens]TXK26035.1 DUF4917 family protein [Bacillus amyloliquefaciens]TXK32612.1 DUF4917 family protein [Bacillus amyloliquefaciens]WBY35496.1 DUF4917 family protein [Bacillus amyloliquefaciens]WJM56463.1 DUF4917 family protein [Bacillus amyloliquefaciens]
MKSFTDLVFEHPEILDNFLFGNGFSQSFHSAFKYKSLYDNVKNNLEAADRRLFEDVLDTTNFEMVLNRILNTQDVNKAYSLCNNHLDQSYQNIKLHLIHSVNKSHPCYEEIATSIDRLAWSFGIFKYNIFTTNYDLLTYWGFIELWKNNRKVNDGFLTKNERLIFDHENFKSNDLRFYYLHGALHFFEENGKIVKAKPNKKNLLESITKQFEDGKFPLYVSEGSTEKKTEQIHSNYYLLICFIKLLDISNGITIFGHDLNEEYDQHLLEILNGSEKLKYIAYGIYPTEEYTYKDIENRIERLFRHSNKTLLFFDSRTFFDSVKEIANEGLHWMKNPGGFPRNEALVVFDHNLLYKKASPSQ